MKWFINLFKKSGVNWPIYRPIVNNCTGSRHYTRPLGFFSRNVSQVTPKISYFHSLKGSFRSSIGYRMATLHGSKHWTAFECFRGHTVFTANQVIPNLMYWYHTNENSCGIEASDNQCFMFSRNIGQLTPKIIYFYNLK